MPRQKARESARKRRRRFPRAGTRRSSRQLPAAPPRRRPQFRLCAVHAPAGWHTLCARQSVAERRQVARLLALPVAPEAVQAGHHSECRACSSRACHAAPGKQLPVGLQRGYLLAERFCTVISEPFALLGMSQKEIRVLSSPRQATRLPRVTQDGLLTVAAFRPWRSSQCPAAQDPAPGEAKRTHESWRRGRDLNPRGR